MINLRNSPFLWFAILLIVANGLCDMTSEQPFSSSFSMMLAICTIAGVFCGRRYSSKRTLWPTLALSLCILTAGAVRYNSYEHSLFPDPVLAKPTKVHLVAEVSKVLKVKDRATTLKCHLLEANPIQTDAKIPGDKFILIRIKGNPPAFLPGDQLSAPGWLMPIQASLNPHAFDLQAYYRTIGIRHQMSCADTAMQVVAGKRLALMRISAHWQYKMCKVIRSNTSDQVAQLTNALVFGERSSMDAEIRDAFSDAGAMHVLSVSGMHMAIIYSLLYLLLGPPGKGTLRKRWWRLSIYTISIILYMAITGASPAVVRAGIMIMLFILGKSMGWNTGVWNLLGFAAFLMAWQDPFIWKNIGFQLSFLAMAGILLYTQPIIRFLSFKSIVLHRIWQITAVSLAAQIFIFPLILFHFHQFPLTFALSSLIAMPAGYLIIFGALLNILLSPLSIDLLWSLFDHTGLLFLTSMQWLAEINPHMNFSMPLSTMIFLLAAAVVFTAGLMYQWTSGKPWATGCLIAAILSLSWHRTVQWTRSDLTMYHNYNGFIVDLFDKGNCYSLQDSTVSDVQVEFVARGQRVYRDMISHTRLDDHQAYARANRHFSVDGFFSSNLSVSFWSRNVIVGKKQGHTRYLVIDKSEEPELLKDFLKQNPDVFTILPANADRRLKSQLIDFLHQNNLRYHDISTAGYLSIPL